MIIKPNKSIIATVSLLMVVILFLFLILYFRYQTLIGAVSVNIVPFVIVVRYWIATGRTISIRKDGITVCFLWYRRHYAWENLKTKHFGNYEKCFGYKSPYLGGAEFSPNFFRRPMWLKPAEYCILIHPLTHIFVYFQPRKLSKIDTRYPMIYVVDEADFREIINNWGIDLREA